MAGARNAGIGSGAAAIRVAVALVALALGTLADAAPRDLNWADLKPAPSTTPLADPFAKLGEDQLELLRGIVRLRTLEARGFVPGAEAKAQRDAAIRTLEAQGLSVEALLAAREAIIAQRRAEAEGAVAALDGKEVRLPGFLLPIDGADGKVTEFLLVAIPGACSHATPPPANQVVRVRPAEPSALQRDYQPATVQGRLRVHVQTRPLFVVDGSLDITSAYAIDAATIVTGFPPDPARAPAATPASR